MRRSGDGFFPSPKAKLRPMVRWLRPLDIPSTIALWRGCFERRLRNYCRGNESSEPGAKSSSALKLQRSSGFAYAWKAFSFRAAKSTLRHINTCLELGTLRTDPQAMR